MAKQKFGLLFVSQEARVWGGCSLSLPPFSVLQIGVPRVLVEMLKSSYQFRGLAGSFASIHLQHIPCLLIGNCLPLQTSEQTTLLPSGALFAFFGVRVPL